MHKFRNSFNVLRNIDINYNNTKTMHWKRRTDLLFGNNRRCTCQSGLVEIVQ